MWEQYHLKSSVTTAGSQSARAMVAEQLQVRRLNKCFPIWSWLTDAPSPPGSSEDRESHSWRPTQGGALRIHNQSPNAQWSKMFTCLCKNTKRCMLENLLFNWGYEIGYMCYNMQISSNKSSLCFICNIYHPMPELHNSWSKSLQRH